MKHSLIYKDLVGNDFAPSAPTLETPINGAITSTVVFFDWSDSTDGDGDAVTYTIEIADDSTFSSVSLADNQGVCVGGHPIYRQQRLEISATFADKEDALCDGQEYSWRVTAVDPYGKHATSSNATFNTNNQNAGQITPISILVKSNINSLKLRSANVGNNGASGLLSGDFRGKAHVVKYKGNYVIFTVNQGRLQTITAKQTGYTQASDSIDVPSNNTETIKVKLALKPEGNIDTDGDGVNDQDDNCPSEVNPGQENNDVADGDVKGDACDIDDDNDGITDQFETDNGLLPFDPTDADDDPDMDGLNNLEEAQEGTDPQDANDPGLGADSDQDGVINTIDNCPTVANNAQTNFDGDLLGDECDSDDDNDGMDDAFEILYGLLPRDPSDAGDDADEDGLTNLEEYQRGSSPVIKESTVDTVKDVMKSVKKLLKNKSIKTHGKSNKYMKKAKAHLQKALGYLDMSDEINARAQVDKAIADLKKVKKKKSKVKKLINDLKTI
jgi:hypothetical protein